MSPDDQPFSPLHGVRITVSKYLTGSKRAVQLGDGPIGVSPAMFDLIEHATPEELKRLLSAIHVLRLPAMPSLSDLANVPMYTSPPVDEFARDISMLRRYFS